MASPGTHATTRLETLKDFWSPELGNRRDILVYVPASYHREHRAYPVLYMHDGQNLFDPVTSFAGDWKLGNVMASAARRGIEAIVVGIPNMGTERLAEYSPFVDPVEGGGCGRSVSRLPRPDTQAGDRRTVSHAGGERAHGHRRLVHGRTHQPLCVLPDALGIRVRRSPEPLALVRRRCDLLGGRACTASFRSYLPRHRRRSKARRMWRVPAECETCSSERDTSWAATSAGWSHAAAGTTRRPGRVASPGLFHFS